MRSFTNAIAIAASLERVWEILIDVERWREWTPSIERVERLDSAPLHVGSKVRIEQPKLRPAVWTITLWEPPRRFVWISHNPGVEARATHDLESTADGCVLKLGLEFGGLFGALAGRLNRHLIDRYLALEAAGLKRRCEHTTS